MDFEIIKKRIAKHKHSSLVYEILKLLKQIQQPGQPRYAFWELLVLLKWVFIYSPDDRYKTTANKKDIQSILSLISNFNSENSDFKFKSDYDLKRFLRIIAFQQFSLQNSFYATLLHRQFILFKGNKNNFDINESFLRYTGMDIQQFCKYSYFTFIYINRDKLLQGFKYEGVLKEDYFSLFRELFAEDPSEKYLPLLTATNANEIQDLQKLNNPLLQLYETNLFARKPFLYFKDEYHILHKSVFVQTLSQFIYDYLKVKEPNKFSNELGVRLEKYVLLGLKENDINTETENDLKRKYPVKKVSDFLIDKEVLIEVKAVELSPRSGVSREATLLASDLKDSVVKAYCQLLSTANTIKSAHELFGVIITYKEMYLGFGPDAYHEFLSGPVQKFIDEEKIDISILPPSNLFFISISDWDWIMQAIKSGFAKSVKEILMKGRELNSTPNPVDRIFMMEQVLNKYYSINTFNLAYLEKVRELLDFVVTN
ncbi:MAG: hypothetical protein ABIN36_07435 [Ferruginibacter sp.]